MKSTILLQVIALPAALAANFAELYILAGKDQYGVHVTGKKDPNAEVTQMKSTTPGFDQNLQCLHDDGTWSRWACNGKPMYRQVGEFDFPQATEDPRPFLMEYPLENSLTGMTQACNITVTGGGNYTWSPTEQWLGLETNDAVKVDCSEDLTALEIHRQKTSGTQWEKDFWAAMDAVDQAEYDAYRSQIADEILPTST